MIKSNNKIIFFSILFVALIFFPVASTLAQTASPTTSGGLVPCGNDINNPCGTCDIFKLIDNIKNFLILYIIPPVSVLFVVIAGFLILTGGAQPSNYAYGKKILKDLAYGLAFIFGAWLIANTILQLVTGDKNISGSWYKIECSATGIQISKGTGGSGGGSTFSCVSSPIRLSATQKTATFSIRGGKSPLTCTWPTAPQGSRYTSLNGCSAVVAFNDEKSSHSISVPVTDSSSPVKNTTVTCSVAGQSQSAPPTPTPTSGGGGTALTCPNIDKLITDVRGVGAARCPDRGQCPDCKPITMSATRSGLKASASLANFLNNQFGPALRTAGITANITEAMCPVKSHASCAHFNGHAVDFSYTTGNIANNLTKVCEILNSLGLRGKSSIGSNERGVYMLEKASPGGACPARCASCGTASLHIQI